MEKDKLKNFAIWLFEQKAKNYKFNVGLIDDLVDSYIEENSAKKE